jgi:hypothetical protein
MVGSASLCAVCLTLSPVARASPGASDEIVDATHEALRAQEPVTPESANSARFGVEQEGKQLSDAGAFDQAAELYWTKGVELKDPVLIIDSAEALRDKAATERSIPAAEAAIERVAPALDMLYFLRDGATSDNWQPIAPEYVATVIDRGEALITDAEAVITEIEAEQAAAAEAATEPVDEGKGERKPGKPGAGLIAGGAAGLVVGAGGLALGVAGLGLGARAQSTVENPTVYAKEHREAESQGRNANVMAGVGLALGGVGLILGATLLALGLKKRKAAGGSSEPSEAVEARVAPIWLQGGAGVGVSGSF